MYALEPSVLKRARGPFGQPIMAEEIEIDAERETGKTQRPRQKNMAAVKTIISPVFSKTQSFAMYGELLDQSPLQIGIMMPYKAWLQMLFPIGPIYQSDLKALLLEIHLQHKEDMTPTWTLKDDLSNAWAEKVAKRIRTMLRHLKNGEKKRPSPFGLD